MRFFAKCFDLKGWKSCLFGVLLTKKKLRALISSLAVHRRVKSSSVPCCEYISDLFSVLDRSSESKLGLGGKKQTIHGRFRFCFLLMWRWRWTITPFKVMVFLLLPGHELDTEIVNTRSTRAHLRQAQCLELLPRAWVRSVFVRVFVNGFLGILRSER